MNATDIVAYTYRAETLCPACAVEVVQAAYPYFNASTGDVEGFLAKAADFLGIDYFDAASYDSDDFPKVVFADQMTGDYCDCCDVERCGACGEALL